MNLTWLIRMAKWARRPPSAKMVVMVLGIVGFCLVLFAIERFIGWPDWASIERMPRWR